jgi:4'-phosphopantetheinyl transferase EntD
MRTGLHGLIERLMPPTVAAEETFSDIDGATLFAEEEAAIARSAPKRRREFTTVRSCARTAMGRLGVAPAPIVPGPRGAPGWPDGVVGSMTHCDGYRACAVALRRDICAIGLDAEPAGAMPDGVLEAIALPQERVALLRLARDVPRVPWDRLLFSAKEAVYKAWFPMTRARLDFDEAVVDFAPGERTFDARLLVRGPATAQGTLTGFSGRWLHERGLVICAIVLPSELVRTSV